MNVHFKRSIKGLQSSIVQIAGRFFPDGSSALDSDYTLGSGFTVAYTSTGLYTITLSKRYAQLVGAHATFQSSAANADMYCQFGDYVAASKTITIQMKTAGTNTDAASYDANQSVSFLLIVRESDIN